jgi:hypothetical protein
MQESRSGRLQTQPPPPPKTFLVGVHFQVRLGAIHGPPSQARFIGLPLDFLLGQRAIGQQVPQPSHRCIALTAAAVGPSQACPCLACPPLALAASSHDPLTIATTCCRVVSGSSGHAATTAARSGGNGADRAPTAPDSAPPSGRHPGFPDDFGGGSIPAASTFKFVRTGAP